MIKRMLLLILVSSVACMARETKQKPYEANWSSLRRHNTPQWLDGLKFGIYCHWGPQSVKHEYKDYDMGTLEAIEKWKGEKYSASEWVDLFEAAGAQFAGPVAWHGSGMLNWDSKITDWNSVQKGPGVDIFGSLAEELRKRDMNGGKKWSSFISPLIYHLGLE